MHFRSWNRQLGIGLVCCYLQIAAGCGGDDDSDDSKRGTDSEGAVGEIEDSSLAGLVAFAKSGVYRSWSGQPEVIEGVSAHRTYSRTFANETALSADSSSPFPVGSIFAKDMYSSDKSEVVGQAIMAKVAAGEESDTWLWFEGFSPSYSDPYYGRDVSTCTGCHSTGNDYVRTSLDSLASD